jgi:ABC-type dipeptide/oligopeptide/nickel transport system permease subunit
MIDTTFANDGKRQQRSKVSFRRPLWVTLAETVRAVLSNRGGRWIGTMLVAVMLLVALLGPHIFPIDPNLQDIANRFAGPSTSHLLGTDYLGRDLLARLICGCRIAMSVAFGSISLSAIVGVILGVVSGYLEGSKLDYVIILVFDVVRSFPQVVLALAIVAVLGCSMINLILALAFTVFPFYGRIARAQTLSVKESDFVKAAEAMGLHRIKIIFRHILPNILAPVIVCLGMDLATIIIYEAGLSFLGLGVKPPTASWGIMLRNGYQYIETSPWMIIWPGVAISLSMIAFSLFSEGLRVALDPKQRQRNV